MRNTIIVTIILFVAIIGASVYYFTNLDGAKKETFRPLSFLPKETYAIVTFQNDETTDHIFQDFEIFEAMVGRQTYASWKDLQSNLLRKPDLQPYVKGVNQYISFHPDGENIATLFTIPTREPIAPENLRSFLEKAGVGYTVTAKDTLGSQIYQLDKGVKDSVFHIVYKKDIFFASYNDNLLYKILDEKQPKLTQQETDYFI